MCMYKKLSLKTEYSEHSPANSHHPVATPEPQQTPCSQATQMLATSLLYGVTHTLAQHRPAYRGGTQEGSVLMVVLSLLDE